MFSDLFFLKKIAFCTCFGAIALRTFTVKSLLSVSFQFLLLFILVAMFHKTVVFKYLLVLDRSFMARGLSDCVLVGAICCPR